MTKADPHLVTDITELEALYGAPAEAATLKVADHLTPLYAKWIMAARFCILSTVGPEGTDGSPRGDDGPVVQIQDPKTLLMPDWRGNNRMDSLRNIVADGRISLMFMVPGSLNVIRVNGSAVVTRDPARLARFDDRGTLPRSVIVITLKEVYSQCGRAILRAKLWQAGDQSADLPGVGALLAEQKAGFDGAGYDAGWRARAEDTLW